MNRNASEETNSRVGIFADTQNMYYSGKSEGVRLDYAKLRPYLANGRDVIVANAYLLTKDLDQVESFKGALYNAGFDTHIREMEFKDIVRRDPENVGNVKETEVRQRNVVNWEVGMLLDMMKWMPKLDVIILVSGNGFFAEFFQHLKNTTGIRLEVAGFKRSINRDLKEVCHDVIDLAPVSPSNLPAWLTSFDKESVLVGSK